MTGSSEKTGEVKIGCHMKGGTLCQKNNMDAIGWIGSNRISIDYAQKSPRTLFELDMNSNCRLPDVGGALDLCSIQA